MKAKAYAASNLGRRSEDGRPIIIAYLGWAATAGRWRRYSLEQLNGGDRRVCVARGVQLGEGSLMVGFVR